MHVKIEMTAEVVRKNGTSTKGKAYDFRNQVGYLHGVGKYPVKTSIPLKEGREPYTPGLYVLLPESVYVNKFGELALYPQLAPAATATGAAPARAA
jgi:hypothetical protein